MGSLISGALRALLKLYDDDDDDVNIMMVMVIMQILLGDEENYGAGGNGRLQKTVMMSFLQRERR